MGNPENVARRRPWRVEIAEVMADTMASIRGWGYTRRQVVVLGFVCAAGLAAAAGLAIFAGIIVQIVTGGE